MAEVIVDEKQTDSPERQAERREKPRGKAGAGIMVMGLSIQAVTGVIAVVLTALALAQILPALFLTIAIIVLGVGLFFRGGASAAEHTMLVRENDGKVAVGVSPSGGASAELIAGAVGIVLGVLALFSIAPQVLAPVALIILAIGLMMNSMTNVRIGKLRLAMSGIDGPVREASINSVWADSGTQVATSIGALVLGALALLGFSPLGLTIVGILALGVVEALVDGGLVSWALGFSKGSDTRSESRVART